MAQKNGKEVFADACYWIALIDPEDPLHKAAVGAKSATIGRRIIVTSDWVLNEMLTYFLVKLDEKYIRNALSFYDKIVDNPNIIVEPATRIHFLNAIELCRTKYIRGCSVVDYTSFSIMNDKGITGVLTADNHFKNAGFKRLMGTK